MAGRDSWCARPTSPRDTPAPGLRDAGNSRNWPIAPGTPREEHMAALRESLDAVAAFQPDLVLVSAGFDAYARDPITEMTLEAEDFATLGGWLRQTGLAAASVLEGDYSPDLPVLVEAYLAAWAAQPVLNRPASPRDAPFPRPR